MPGFSLTYDDIDVEEWEALRALKSERSKWEQEQMKQPTGK
jgi:hypothetical protein